MDVQENIRKLEGENESLRLAMASDALDTLLHEIKHLGKDDPGPVVIALIKFFVSADKSTSRKEVALFNELFGSDWDFQTFYEATNGGSEPGFAKAIKSYIEELPEKAKEACCVLAITFMLADGPLAVEETNLLIEAFGQ